MKELLDKLSSYNLFNYLLPGILFAVLATQFTSYSFMQENLVEGVFVYYFTGLIISRVGSLIIEPISKRIHFVEYADYKDYIAASKQDSKIELLSEVNNMYRTLTSLFISLLMFKSYDSFEARLPLLRNWNPYLLFAALSVMFLLSYRKQTEYITKRVKSN